MATTRQKTIDGLKDLATKYMEIEKRVLLECDKQTKVYVPEFIAESLEFIKTLWPDDLKDKRNLELVSHHLELAFNQGVVRVAILPPEYDVICKTVGAAIYTRQFQSSAKFEAIVKNCLVIMYKLGCQDRGDYLDCQNLTNIKTGDNVL